VAIVTHSQVYFARSDALSGSLVETLRNINPTLFFAVPRIFEKFEEKIKEGIESSSLIKRKVIKWAQKIGHKTVERKFKDQKPSLLYGIADYLVFSRVKAALGFTNTKVVAYGAAPMRKSTIDFFKSINIPLFNNYGMSETTGPQFMNLSSKNVDLYSAGITLKGTDVKINYPDRDGVGEIFFRGRNRFMGYLKDEKSTKETIDEYGYIHSGDLGYFNSKGNLVITGRLKEMIITAGGENVAPIPIEESLKDFCNFISNVVIIGDKRPYLTALITLKSDQQGNLHEDTVDMIRKFDAESTILTVEDAVGDLKVNSVIQSAIDKVNQRVVSRAQIIRKWCLLPTDFSIESGDLTPTHKLKRNIITQKYIMFIEKLYNNSKF
jgi:long-chain-fatty-acid--CoA ligase ACSBG